MGEARGWRGTRIYTVGHSTRTLEELVALLRSFEIEVLADIRTVPLVPSDSLSRDLSGCAARLTT
jgi:uncharacterized protein (DUF488 family)